LAKADAQPIRGDGGDREAIARGVGHRVRRRPARIVNIKGIRMDAEFGPSMLYITNQDKPGFIGRFSSMLGDAGINIATFHVGRDAPGANAIALIEVDGEVPAEVLRKVQALPQVQQAKPLRF
jgi:D-3-phosphoglycerate dehydrogenase